MYRKRVITALIILSAIFLVAERCLAFQAGQVAIDVTGIADARYDDNVTLVRDNEQDDYVTSLGFALSATHEGRTSGLQLNNTLRRNLYADNNQFDNWSDDMNVRYLQELSRYDQLLVTDTFTYAEEPTSFVDEFGSTSGRYATRRNRFGFNYSREFSKQNTVTGRYSNEYTAYSRDDLAKSGLHTVGVETGHVLNSSLSALAAYDFYIRTFRPGNNACVHSLTGGFKKYVTSQLSAEATCGVDFITAYNNEQYAKPAFSVSLSDDVDESTRATLGFTKRYETTAATQDIFGNWQASAGLSKRLRERLGSSASLFYGKGKYEVFDVKDQFQGADLGITYDLSKTAQGTIGYRYSQTLSNFEGREYRRNLYTAGVRVQF